MKKKIVSLLLALSLIATFGVTALATSTTSQFLTLDNTSLNLKLGDFTLLTAYLSGIPTADVSWSTNDPSIATVNNNGTVTGVKLGMTVVTAISNSTGLSASCSVNIAFKGIDVSKYQKDINWGSVKASGVDFAIIRAGFTGSDALNPQIDPYFNANYNSAKQAGIQVGVYYYSCATTVALAAQEANMLLAILNGQPLDYPVFYDIEYSSQRTLPSDQMANVVTTFCDIVQNAGYKVGIYSSPSIFNTNLSSSLLDKYDRWVANWGVSSPNFSKPYTMWQYGYGTVPGITTGVVDVDYSYKDYSSNSQTGSGQIPGGQGGNDQLVTTPIQTLQSDTNAPYTFGSNSTYCYKIITNNAARPIAVSSNSSVVSVAYSQKVTGGYLYKITNVGAGTAQITTTDSDGSFVSFAAIGRVNSVISDTTMPFTMKRGATYQFKLTPVGTTGVPKITTGNGSVLSVTTSQKIGSSYYIKVLAKAKGCTSVYTTLPGQAAVRQCMVTVA